MSVLRQQDRDILASIRWAQEEQDGYPTIEEIVERALIIDRERVARLIEELPKEPYVTGGPFLTSYHWEDGFKLAISDAARIIRRGSRR